jgi:transposase
VPSREGPTDDDLSGGVSRAGDRALTEEGLTRTEVAAVLGVSGSWVNSIKRRHRAGRPPAPKSRANKRQSLAKRMGDAIRARVAEHPGTTREDLKRDLNLDASIANIWYAVRALGLSLKKKRSGQPSGTGPTSPPPGRRGGSSGPASTRAGSPSSTKPSARRR